MESLLYRSALKLGWLATALSAGALAGCGSGGSSTITVGNESDISSVPHVKGETTPAPPAPTVSTPTSGPLSKKPTIKPPGGAAPKKLVIKDLVKGTGPEAKAGEEVTVNYVGVLYKNGKEFDSSWKRSEPFKFALGQGKVIKGWDEGVAGMKVGERRELIIPAALGYGAKASGPIPANSALIFVVDLLGV